MEHDCNLADIERRVARNEIAIKHINNGVNIVDCLNTYIGADVIIERGATICPNTYLEGATKIGQYCVIGPQTKICDSEILEGATVEFSVVLNSTVGKFTNVGPFAYIRPNSIIGEHCKIGDFVEVKNSTIGNNSKASHLTYVGDSDVGNNVNFGCGTVTVNYDGANKARTTICDNTFIGCNTNLIAPVTIGENAYTAAGSTITEDVPPNALGIARARQINKTSWKRKAKKL